MKYKNNCNHLLCIKILLWLGLWIIRFTYWLVCATCFCHHNWWGINICIFFSIENIKVLFTCPAYLLFGPDETSLPSLSFKNPLCDQYARSKVKDFTWLGFLGSCMLVVLEFIEITHLLPASFSLCWSYSQFKSIKTQIANLIFF